MSNGSPLRVGFMLRPERRSNGDKLWTLKLREGFEAAEPEDLGNVSPIRERPSPAGLNGPSVVEII